MPANCILPKWYLSFFISSFNVWLISIGASSWRLCFWRKPVNWFLSQLPWHECFLDVMPASKLFSFAVAIHWKSTKIFCCLYLDFLQESVIITTIKTVRNAAKSKLSFMLSASRNWIIKLSPGFFIFFPDYGHPVDIIPLFFIIFQDFWWKWLISLCCI